MIAFTGSWSGGTGPIRHRAPSTRLGCGILSFASCSAVSLSDPWGRALFLSVLTGWVVGCGIPLRKLKKVLFFSACLFLPFFLLVPFIHLEPGSASWADAFRIPLVIALRGTACIVVCAATMSALELSEFGRGLAGLPLPRTIRSLILQITHQTAMLTDESRRMAAALRVRGVSSAGIVVRLRCLFALPVIWLLRLMLRAERVSAAMEVRGFDGMSSGLDSKEGSFADRCTVAFWFVVFGVVLIHRWGVAS